MNLSIASTSSPLIERNHGIDIARGIGILLVVLGHNWIILFYNGGPFRIIFSFHMPLFFFLSGTFLKADESTAKFLWTRADSLLKPYFTTLTSVGLMKLLWGMPLQASYFLNVVYASGPTIEWSPLWFLPHLFLSLLIAHYIIQIPRPLKQTLLWPFCILLLVFGPTLLRHFGPIDPLTTVATDKSSFEAASLPGLPFSLDILPVSLAYILIGHLASNYTTLPRFRFTLLAISFTLFFSLHFWFDETMDLNLRKYGNIFLMPIESLSGIGITLGIAYALNNFSIARKLFSYMGKNSLFILIFHWPIQRKATELFMQFQHVTPISLIAIFLLGVLIPLVFYEIAKRIKILATMLLPRRNTLTG